MLIWQVKRNCYLLGFGLLGRASALTPLVARVCFKRLLCSNQVCMSSSESLSLLLSLLYTKSYINNGKSLKHFYINKILWTLEPVVNSWACSLWITFIPCYLSWLMCSTCWTREMICCCSLTFWSWFLRSINTVSLSRFDSEINYQHISLKHHIYMHTAVNLGPSVQPTIPTKHFFFHLLNFSFELFQITVP